MNATDIKDLALQTLFSPREAAGRIIAMDLPRSWLWTALALMSVLNGIVYSAPLIAGRGAGAEAPQMIPPAFQSPVLFTLFLFFALALTVAALTWVGRKLGGTGDLRSVLALIAWMQVLRLMVQLGLLILMLALPLGGVVLVLVTSVWGMVILVAFIDRAHEFNNYFKSIASLVLAVLAIVIGLSAILSVLATTVTGGA